jgi:inner membrane protein
MFIAHLPAGYCLTTLLLTRFARRENHQAYRRYLWIGLGASLLPDIDLIFFYLIDLRRHVHHSYITHIPFYWLAGGLMVGLSVAMLRQRCVLRGTIIVISNVMLHLLLDSVASKVHWLYPVSNVGLGLFHVPSRYGWWVWNYILHWTFGLEIMIVVAAGCLLYYKNTTEPEHRICKGKLSSCGSPF